MIITQCLKHMYCYISEATDEEIAALSKVAKDAEFMTLHTGIPFINPLLDPKIIVQKECKKCLVGEPAFEDSDFAKAGLFKSPDAGTMCHESTFTGPNIP